MLVCTADSASMSLTVWEPIRPGLCMVPLCGRNKDQEAGSLDLLKSGFLCQASSERMIGPL